MGEQGSVKKTIRERKRETKLVWWLRGGVYAEKAKRAAVVVPLVCSVVQQGSEMHGVSGGSPI